ncbi:MAG: hypothetical protein ACJAWO_000460 [Halieaceae bacterium]|jgi:uncharacterized protein YjbI with pentapeptide repeats
MLGIDFSMCNPFLLRFNFAHCQLSFSSFYQLKIKGTSFISCHLTEVDFVNTNLQLAIFDACNLVGAQFENTLLEKANFLTAIGYSINPELNYIHGAKFSTHGLSGLLTKYNLDIAD